jgi:hypothetical protein
MKTNRTARWAAGIRIVALCLMIATIAGIEFAVSQSLANRVGQIAAQTDAQQVSTVNIADFIVAAR